MFGFPQVDLYLARVLAGVLLLIALETLINLILEMYRPRVKGKVERPVYESRLVSLLGQPEGLFTTAAQTWITSLASRFRKPGFTGSLCNGCPG